eukprot:1091691-Pleurochrysis_carterae.AAC.2
MVSSRRSRESTCARHRSSARSRALLMAGLGCASIRAAQTHVLPIPVSSQSQPPRIGPCGGFASSRRCTSRSPSSSSYSGARSMLSMKARLCFWYGRSDARSPSGSGSSSGYTCATSCITRSAVHLSARWSSGARIEETATGGCSGVCVRAADSGSAGAGGAPRWGNRAGGAAGGPSGLLQAVRSSLHFASLLVA